MQLMPTTSSTLKRDHQCVIVKSYMNDELDLATAVERHASAVDRMLLVEHHMAPDYRMLAVEYGALDAYE